MGDTVIHRQNKHAAQSYPQGGHPRKPLPQWASPVQKLHRLDHPERYRLARDKGVTVEPAETLTPNDRRILIYTFWRWGWTDTEVAEWTGWTPYTAARLRTGLELEPNTGKQQEVA